MALKSKASLFPYLATGLTWGCSFLFIKFSLGFLTPFGVAFGRCFLGAVTLFVIARVRGVAFPKERRVWLHLWLLAMCINVLPGILFALAETKTTSILASIINALVPITSLFFIAIVFRDDKISPSQMAGLGIGLVGVLVVLGVWQGLGSSPWWAVGSLLLAVTLYGVTFPYTRRYIIPLKLEPVALASTQLILGAMTLLPTFLINGTNGHAVTGKAVFGIIALGMFGSGLAFMWNFRSIELLGSSVASTVTYLSPVVATIVSVIFLSEPITWFQPVGGLIVLIGAAIAQDRVRIPLPHKVLSDLSDAHDTP